MNVGTWDRWLRIVLGIAILAFVPQTLWALVGIVPLVTGILGYCPIYQLLGWSTKRRATTA